MMQKTWRIAALLVAFVPSAALAQELTFGIGGADYPDGGQDTEIYSIEYKHHPFFERGRLTTSLAANVSVSGESDAFVGVGIVTRFAFDDAWFADFGLIPGLHNESEPGNDLGTSFNFRSLLSVGYRFESGRALSLAITHKSNASLDERNPGVDAVLLRYHVPL